MSGFVPIAGAIGSTATDLKDAFTPDDDLFKDASLALWRRLMAQGVTGQFAESVLERAHAQIVKGLAVCDSPIEKQVLPYLVCQDYGLVGNSFAVVHIPKTEDELPIAPVVIVPQMAILKYRFDFGLVTDFCGHPLIVAVECDGQNWHSANMDRPRDVYLRSWGIPTIRAQGKEIYQSPAGFAMRAAAELTKLIHDVGERSGS